MAYLVVNKDGTEKIFENCPFRWYSFEPDTGITLPHNSIVALTGQKLTFEDEPIKI